MDWGGPGFVLTIIGLAMISWLINNWIRARHGYALEDEWGGKTLPSESKAAKRLEVENQALHEKLDAMQDRMVVLEKIVTDRGYSLAEEIDSLRADTNSGVPLDTGSKERA